MDQDPVQHYRRMLDSAPYLREALCLTYARGLDRQGLIRAFGGDPTATMSRRDFSDRLHHTDVPAVLLVAEIDTWQIGVEEVHGYQGSRIEVLRRAAASGEAVSVYWNVNVNCPACRVVI